MQLTPIAIHEAMGVIETTYRGKPTEPDFATAVFSQPEIGMVGLCEDEATQHFENLEIYRAQFWSMRHTLSGRQEMTIMKRVVDSAARRVLGAHIPGADAGEMAQLLPATDMPGDVVGIGSQVNFRDDTTGKEQNVTLVLPEHADITTGNVSVATPIGIALIGLR